MRPALRRDLTVLTILALVLGSAALIPILLFHIYQQLRGKNGTR